MKMKQYIKLFPMLALTAVMAASCADDEILPFDVAKPESIAQYEYLKNYDVLKSYVDRQAHPGFRLGGAIGANDFINKGVVYELIRTNFDEMTPGNEMKYASIVNDEGVMNFTTVTNFIEAAKEAGVTIYGHTLGWHAQQNLNYLNGLIADQVIEGEPAEPVEVEDAMFDYSTYTSYNYWNQKPEGSEASISISEEGYLHIYNPEVIDPFYAFQYHVADGIPWKSGISYNITIMAKASESTSITVAAGSWASNPGTSVNISSDWSEKVVTLSPNVDENGFIMFQTGNFAGTIDVQWIKVSHMETPMGGGDGGYCMEMFNDEAKTNVYEAQNWYTLSEPLEQGTAYTLSFMAKATSDYAPDFYLKNTSADTQYYPGGFDVITSDWKQITKNFTPEASGIDQLIFNFGTFAGTISVDDISLTAAGSSTNLIPNSDFESGNIDGWTYWTPGQYQRISEYGKGYVSGDQVVPMDPELKKDTLTWALDNWITGMMEACGGYVTAWDAANETVSGTDKDGDGIYELQNASNGDPSTNFYWTDYLGDLDYVRTIIRLARERFAEFGGNPSDLKLFINDFNLESWWDDNKKATSLVEWIKRWEADGVTKIDGIGTQMHVSLILNEEHQKEQEESIVKMFQILAASGKLVKISELDMGVTEVAFSEGLKTEDITYDIQLKMADFYKFIIDKYFEIIPQAQQYGITQWCMTDSPADSGWRGGEPVGLWDLNYNRKPTYAGFANGLAGREIVPPYAAPDEVVTE